MTFHFELINYIIEKLKFRSYLELGTYSKDLNFNKIHCKKKICLDIEPRTGPDIVLSTDDYFKSFDQQKWDIIFCDALHYAEQVKKDIINSWNVLNDGGILICHDANPPTEITTCIPRGTQREWCGTVFKTICQIISPNKFTVDFDYGNCVMHKNGEPLEFVDHEVSWEDFDKHRKELLNLVSVEDAIKIIDKW